MATATLVTDLTMITDCSDDTNWSNSTDTTAVDTVIFKEGDSSIGFNIKTASDTHLQVYDIGSAIDLTNTHLRMWFTTTLKALLKDLVDGGIQIYMSDGTNGGYWNVSGGDKYIGGWEILIADTAQAPNEGTQPDMSAITTVGFNCKLATATVGTVSTTWVDWIAYGKGYTVYGGDSTDPINLDAIVSSDSYYGVLSKGNGVYFINGEIQLGDSAGTNGTYFSDESQMIVYQDLLVSDTLFKLFATGNTTTDTFVNLKGNFISSVSDPLTLDFSDNTTVSSVILDGCVLQRVSTFNGSTNVSCIGTVFDQCKRLNPNGATLENFTVKNSNDVSALLWADNISKGIFNSSGTGHAIEFDTAGEYTLTELYYNGYADVDGDTGNECIYNNSGGAITLNIQGGDTPTVRNGVDATTTLVINPVDVVITVKDLETGNPIEGARVYLIADAGGDLDEGTVLFNDLTDSNGQVSLTQSFSSDQPVKGWVRKSSEEPYYKTYVIAGTINASTGLNITAQMILDE